MFDTTDSKVASTKQALEIRETIRAAYADAKRIRDLLALYGNDPSYTATVNAIYSADERAELSAVVAHFQALAAELETNHAAVIAPA